MKRNKTELFVVRWLDLDSVTQSQVSWKEKNKYRMLGISMESEKIMVLMNIGAGQE